jgi:Mycothiol-dependent nitroreductase Rv2466c
MRRVTLHFDPNCPWTWLTSRWLVGVAEKEGLAVGLVPFSLAHLARDDADTWTTEQRTVRDSGQAVLRLIEHLARSGDEATAHRVYAAWGELAHHQGRTRDHALVAELLDRLDLDPDATAATADTTLDAAIGRRTDAALAAVGEGVGSPILEWDDNGGTVWIFGPILDELPDEAASADLWCGVQLLAREERFKELKRGRNDSPRMPAV